MLRRKIKHETGYMGTLEEGCTIAILNKENLTEVTFEYRSKDKGVSNVNNQEKNCPSRRSS